MLERLQAAADTQRQLIEESSHELRIPLSVLATNADVLLSHPDPSIEVYRQGLERSKRAAERLQATIDELLIEARRRARTLDQAPADPMVLVRGVIDDAAVLATTKGIDLQVTGPSGAGLGLPIAHQIAVAHGGRLTVTSPGPTGDGCVFRLILHR